MKSKLPKDTGLRFTAEENGDIVFIPWESISFINYTSQTKQVFVYTKCKNKLDFDEISEEEFQKILERHSAYLIRSGHG